MRKVVILKSVSGLLMLSVIFSFLSCSVGDDTPPSTTTDLTINSLTRIINWTAAGDDGDSGTASIFFVRFLDNEQVSELCSCSLVDTPFPVIEEVVRNNFDEATQVPDFQRPMEAGSLETFITPRLDILGKGTFFYSLRTSDEVGNMSEPSNVVEIKTPLQSVQYRDVNSTDSSSCLGQSIGYGDFGETEEQKEDDDSDDFDDVVIGDPCSGKAYIFFGRNDLTLGSDNSVINVSEADVTIIGNAGDLFGSSVAGVGEFGGDGRFDEVAIGATGFDGDRGEVIIIFGDEELPRVIDLNGVDEHDILITGENPGDVFGSVIVKRNSTDIYVGAPGAVSQRGKTYRFKGGDLNTVTPAIDAKGIVIGEAAGDMFGFSISNSMKLNGTSSNEFSVSSPGGGKAYVFFGEFDDVQDLSQDTSDVVILQGNVSDQFGFSVSGGEDIEEDDDEETDFVVGAPGANQDTGSVFFYSGADIQNAEDSGISPQFKSVFRGSNSGDRFGTSLSVFNGLAPEVEMDPRDTAIVLELDNVTSDFAVGAPGNSDGAVYIFLGRESFPAQVLASEADVVLQGDVNSNEFGINVSSVGDPNLDLLEDFGVGGSDFVSLEY